MFQKKIQDNNSKLNGRNNNKSPLIAQENNPNGLPITYFWYHGITPIFATTVNLANVRKKATN